MKKITTRTLALVACLAAASVLTGGSGNAAAQSVATHAPNFTGGWTAPPGVIQLNFLHRFSVTHAPLRKVINTPTFNVSTGLTHRISAGFVYGSNSNLVPAYPNEWEFYARAMPLDQHGESPLDLSLQGGWNAASESIDGEVMVARSLGSLRLMAAGRAFSEGYDGTDARYAVAGGAALRLSKSVSVAGDYGVLLDRADDEDAAWSAGLQLGVPYTPHSFSIHVTNVGTASLEGISRGGRTRWGFEYTVPITIRRYLPTGQEEEQQPDLDDAVSPGDLEDVEPPFGSSDRPHGPMVATVYRPPARGPSLLVDATTSDTVFIEIRNVNYAEEEVKVTPGTPLVWLNLDPVQHSVTATDDNFDSGLLEPQEGRFVMTFDEPGTYEYHCTPHPFMKGRIIVEEMTGGGEKGGPR